MLAEEPIDVGLELGGFRIAADLAALGHVRHPVALPDDEVDEPAAAGLDDPQRLASREDRPDPLARQDGGLEVGVGDVGRRR